MPGKPKPAAKKAPAPQPESKRAARRRRAKARRLVPIPEKERMNLLKRIPDQMLAVALPRENNPVRYPVQGQPQKTAVWSLHSIGTWKHMTRTSAPQDSYGFICPSPVHPLWLSQVALLATGHDYCSSIAYRLRESAKLENIDIGSHIKQYSDFRIQSFVRADNAPHLGILERDVAGAPTVFGVHAPQGSVVRVRVSDLRATTGKMDLQVYSFGTETTTYEFNLGVPQSGQHTFYTGTVLTHGGWLTFGRIQAADSTSGTGEDPFEHVTIHFDIMRGEVGKEPLTLLLPAFGPIEEKPLSVVRNSSRITAAAVCITNTTAAIRRGGRFQAARMHAAETSPYNTTEYVKQIGGRAASEMYNGDAKNGLYTFTIPSLDTMTYSDYVHVMADGSLATCFDRADASVFNGFVYSGPAEGAVAAPTSDILIGQEFSFRYDCHEEARTNSQVYPIATAKMPLQTYQDLLTKTVDCVPFTENPLHIPALVAAITRAWNVAAPYAGPLLEAGTSYLANRALEKVRGMYN